MCLEQVGARPSSLPGMNVPVVVVMPLPHLHPFLLSPAPLLHSLSPCREERPRARHVHWADLLSRCACKAFDPTPRVCVCVCEARAASTQDPGPSRVELGGFLCPTNLSLSASPPPSFSLAHSRRSGFRDVWGHTRQGRYVPPCRWHYSLQAAFPPPPSPPLPLLSAFRPSSPPPSKMSLRERAMPGIPFLFPPPGPEWLMRVCG
ncbi:hypothetical protein H696_01688 [Fonticula alba]|uniref:Uncharacterized protein n=1 Tax=Fonticula alba TaxID=691883 RepID=A0A058ZEC0_FONAL|nr:hypothetical protein H696_01688 [Fonticula alba]KCV72291.1 hypothetical protein H696_01688 [Fonticula alba]|eukprot:XP_009493869.1 hypothetical protein H696_01688 [Fonticula alba]